MQQVLKDGDAVVLLMCVMRVFLVMMGVPRSESGSDKNGVFIGRHGVLHVGGNEQEAARRIALETLDVEGIAETHFERSLNDGNSCVRSMAVVIAEARLNKRGIGECFARYVAASFEYGPLGSVGIDLLPLNGLCVPGLRHFVLRRGLRRDEDHI